jgi:hypothetical protein
MVSLKAKGYSMTESETEAETLERLEVALRKIATAAHGPKRPAQKIDRDALVNSLDLLIARLRSGLKSPNAPHHVTE